MILFGGFERYPPRIKPTFSAFLTVRKHDVMFRSPKGAATEFDRSRPVDRQNGETLGLAGPELAALPSSRRSPAVGKRLSAPRWRAAKAFPIAPRPRHLFSSDFLSRIRTDLRGS